MIPKITLKNIRDHKPCKSGWENLLKGLGYSDGQYDPDREVTLGQIAEINGAPDAWWCVRCLNLSDVSVRRSVVVVLLKSVKRAARHTQDQRVHECIQSLDDWCSGKDIDLHATARAAASAAANASANASAWAAARAAARAANAAAADAAALDVARAADAAAWAADADAAAADAAARAADAVADAAAAAVNDAMDAAAWTVDAAAWAVAAARAATTARAAIAADTEERSAQRQDLIDES